MRGPRLNDSKSEKVAVVLQQRPSATLEGHSTNAK